MRRFVFSLWAVSCLALNPGCHSPPALPAAAPGATQYHHETPPVQGPPPEPLPQFPMVTRAECLAMANAYLEHEWAASEANKWHGPDADSIQVDTPDIDFKPAGTFPGWWHAGFMNRGIPYQWGGFCSLDEFDRGIAEGKFAGDIYSSSKRTMLDDAVSKHAVGIDCSGFVSRCWKLPRSYSTRELPGLCVPLKTWDELLPGDILNTHNNHVLIFDRWINEDRSRFASYDTGSPPTWKVQHHGLKRGQITGMGYLPWRYRNMR